MTQKQDEYVGLPKPVIENGKLFLDFSDGFLNEATVLAGMRRAPHGFILPADAPMSLEQELTNTGHVVRRSFG